MNIDLIPSTTISRTVRHIFSGFSSFITFQKEDTKTSVTREEVDVLYPLSFDSKVRVASLGSPVFLDF